MFSFSSWRDDTFQPSERGASIEWGSAHTRAFLRRNDLAFMIRSHECEKNGWRSYHNNKVRSYRFSTCSRNKCMLRFRQAYLHKSFLSSNATGVFTILGFLVQWWVEFRCIRNFDVVNETRVCDIQSRCKRIHVVQVCKNRSSVHCSIHFPFFFLLFCNGIANT